MVTVGVRDAHDPCALRRRFRLRIVLIKERWYRRTRQACLVCYTGEDGEGKLQEFLPRGGIRVVVADRLVLVRGRPQRAWTYSHVVGLRSWWARWWSARYSCIWMQRGRKDGNVEEAAGSSHRHEWRGEMWRRDEASYIASECPADHLLLHVSETSGSQSERDSLLRQPST